MMHEAPGRGLAISDVHIERLDGKACSEQSFSDWGRWSRCSCTFFWTVPWVTRFSSRSALISRRQTSSLRTMSRTCFVRRANSLNMTPRIASSGSTIAITSEAGKRAARRQAQLDAGLAQDRPHCVLDRTHLVQHRAAGNQQRTPQPALPALDMHLPIPASAHDLRQRAGVIAVGLVGHRLHRRIGLPRLDAGRRQAFGVQSIVKPGRQRARFQADPLKRQAGPLQRVTNDCGSLNALASFTIRPVSSAMQIEVSSKDTSSPAKYFMAAPSKCLWRLISTTFSHFDRSSRHHSSGSVETPITPSVWKIGFEGFRLRMKSDSERGCGPN